MLAETRLVHELFPEMTPPLVGFGEHALVTWRCFANVTGQQLT